MKISDIVQSVAAEVKCLRRLLHATPELSGQEYGTNKFVTEYLAAFSPDSLETIAVTGVKAVFLAKNARKTIAFRADMDALPITERTNLEYESKNADVMHACGHDGHTATLLCFARLISQNRDKLNYNVVLIFQPAEESEGGADRMIKEGVLLNPEVNEIYGFHLWPQIEKGKIGTCEGPIMAAMADVDIKIRGKSAHGATPHEGRDALISAVTFLSQAQTIVSRDLDPYTGAVVTFGEMHAGQARNVICEEVLIKGTTRAFEPKVAELVERRLREILIGIEMGMGVRTEFDQPSFYPAVNNPSELVKKFRGILPHEDLVVARPAMTAEDFAFYQKEIPGLFFFLGTMERDNREPLHSSKFNFDENVLLVALEAYMRILEIV